MSVLRWIAGGSAVVLVASAGSVSIDWMQNRPVLDRGDGKLSMGRFESEPPAENVKAVAFDRNGVVNTRSGDLMLYFKKTAEGEVIRSRDIHHDHFWNKAVISNRAGTKLVGNPTPAQLAAARSAHTYACELVKGQKLEGYQALNCG